MPYTIFYFLKNFFWFKRDVFVLVREEIYLWVGVSRYQGQEREGS